MSDANPEVTGELYRRASKTCELIENAAKLMKLAKELGELAQYQTSSAAMETHIGPQIYHVKIPESTEAFVVTLGGDVLEQACSSYDATELRSIGMHGAEFCNRENGSELHIRGLDFTVSPVEQ